MFSEIPSTRNNSFSDDAESVLSYNFSIPASKRQNTVDGANRTHRLKLGKARRSVGNFDNLSDSLASIVENPSNPKITEVKNNEPKITRRPSAPMKITAMRQSLSPIHSDKEETGQSDEDVNELSASQHLGSFKKQLSTSKASPLQQQLSLASSPSVASISPSTSKQSIARHKSEDGIMHSPSRSIFPTAGSNSPSSRDHRTSTISAISGLSSGSHRLGDTIVDRNQQILAESSIVNTRPKKLHKPQPLLAPSASLNEYQVCSGCNTLHVANFSRRSSWIA